MVVTRIGAKRQTEKCAICVLRRARLSRQCYPMVLVVSPKWQKRKSGNCHPRGRRVFLFSDPAEQINQRSICAGVATFRDQ